MSRRRETSASSLPVATMSGGHILLHAARQLYQGLNRHLLRKQSQIVGARRGQKGHAAIHRDARRRRPERGMQSSRQHDPWYCNGPCNFAAKRKDLITGDVIATEVLNGCIRGHREIFRCTR